MASVKEVYSKEKCEEVTTYVSASDKIKDPSITEKYYDLVTDFYEFGWGKSFHFAPQTRTEKTKDAMLRHELKVADTLKLKPGMRVLDVGCGVGGPMKNIAEKSGATIVGVNICGYQIKKAEQYMKESGLDKTCSFYHGTFMDIKLPSNSFDAIYTIEATVHAPDRTACYKELYRLLKPGAFFAGYEYALMDNFDKNNPEHVAIIEDMEHGGGLQKLTSMNEVKQTFIDAGFKVLMFQDDCVDGLTWTLPLEKGVRSSKTARALTNGMVRLLELLKIAPKGSSSVSSFLNLGADAFVQAGKRKIFTPNVFFLMQKPE
ncbi:MAG: methyltransferase domain-containing protein [Chlamydiales bacterium]|nr:methyltransferase domain-containing protein [Chlamydiales bacterium]